MSNSTTSTAKNRLLLLMFNNTHLAGSSAFRRYTRPSDATKQTDAACHCVFEPGLDQCSCAEVSRCRVSVTNCAGRPAPRSGVRDTPRLNSAEMWHAVRSAPENEPVSRPENEQATGSTPRSFFLSFHLPEWKLASAWNYGSGSDWCHRCRRWCMCTRGCSTLIRFDTAHSTRHSSGCR